MSKNRGAHDVPPVAETVAGSLDLALALREVPRLPLPRLRRCVDASMTRSRAQQHLVGLPVSCGGPGCNSCCRGDIEVSGDELVDIMPRLPDWVFAAAIEVRDEIEDDFRRKKVRCPILDKATGLCAIYPWRPMACRTYQVVSPAEYCDVEPGAPAKDVCLVYPNDALLLIIKAMDEEHLLLVEILREADRRAEGRKT